MNGRKVTLIATGDIMLGEDPLYLRRGVKSMILKSDPSFPFHYVANTIREADIAFGNLECSLSRGDTPEWRAPFTAPAGAVQGLRDAGFNVLSLANNHIMEHGNQAAIETMRILDTHNILYVGIGENHRSLRNPVVIELKGVRLAFLAYSFIPIPNYQPLYAEGNLAHIERDIAASAKQGADLIIISLHWGTEYVHVPSPSQTKLAHRLVDLGVNMIIGHHPHVLQKVEFYRGAVIAYSLGDFVFDGNFLYDMKYGIRTRQSIVLKCSASNDGIDNIELLPVYLNQSFQPEIVRGYSSDRIFERLHKLELPHKHLEFAQSQKNYETHARRVQSLVRRCLRIFILRNFHSFSLPTILFLILHRLRKMLNQIISCSRS